MVGVPYPMMIDGIHGEKTLRVGWVEREDGEGEYGSQGRGPEENQCTFLVNPQRINKMLFHTF